jgi:hypothetical protein
MNQTSVFRFPDTGQRACYDKNGREIPAITPRHELWGQDGCFVRHPLSFSKLDGNGESLAPGAAWQDGYRMARDNNTGLVWEIKAPVATEVNFCEDRYTQEEAAGRYIATLNKIKYGGFSDWRLPNKDELRSLVDYSTTNPAIDLCFFPHCRVAAYWCADEYRMEPFCNWVIFFGLGSAIVAAKTSAQYVRAVRGGHQPLFGLPKEERFVINGDGTVTDPITGLMWQQGENSRMNWFAALQACRDMTLGGHDDWRLPNIKELSTILNLNFDDGWWFFKKTFPAEGLKPPLLHYYSSTVHENSYAWVTNFCYGYDGYYASKTLTLLFRAVRTIHPPTALKSCFKLPETGQDLCWDSVGRKISPPAVGSPFYGQDGSFCINPFSFVKLQDGGQELDAKAGWPDGWRTVRDNNTGLIWESKSPDPRDINHGNRRLTFSEASAAYPDELNQIGYGGFSDWRLPNREELRTLADYSGRAPAINGEYFPLCKPAFYWSKDRCVENPLLGWGVYFAYGCAICYLRDKRYYARAVRGGHNPAFGDCTAGNYVDNGDGTISDLNAGLMWIKDESPDMSFEETLRYCTELHTAGHTDWRLPNIRELATLIDLSYRDGVWFHRQFFPNVKIAPLGFYWSSTTFGATFGWGVNFKLGYDGYYAGKRAGRYPFRPVRTLSPCPLNGKKIL